MRTTEELSGNTKSATYVKYDVSDIPEALQQDNSTQQMLHEAIDRIECDVLTQDKLNSMYREFCDIVKKNMDDKLLHKEININKMLSDKRRKVKRDYWNEELDDLYKAFHTADRELSCAHGGS